MTALAKTKTFLIRHLGAKITGIIHGFRFAYLITTKSKTDPEMLFLDQQIKLGDICVDVGANSADWTYFFSKKVGSCGAVYSFEADPYYAYATQVACKLLRLQNVNLFNFGLSDKPEIVSLSISDKTGILLSGTQKIVNNNNCGSDLDHVIPITLRTLDSVAFEYPDIYNAKFIKIDVEGYELFVLRGFEKTIRLNKPILIIEYGDYNNYGYTATDLNQYLVGLGYTGYAVTISGALTKINDNMNCDFVVSSNRIYIP